MIVNIVTGLVALAAVITFMGLYLARIPSVPFWIVTIVCLLLAAFDVWKTLRDERARKDNNGAPG